MKAFFCLCRSVLALGLLAVGRATCGLMAWWLLMGAALARLCVLPWWLLRDDDRPRSGPIQDSGPPRSDH